LRSDDKSSDLVTSWVVESKLSSEEFNDYRQALSVFTKMSNDTTQVILYEIKRNQTDGSIVKKTPLLNSNKAKTRPTSFKRFVHSKPKDKPRDHLKNNNKFKGFKSRIIILIVVLLTFITIMFIMNSISGESSGVTTVQYFDLFKIDNPIYF
jgi:hypothetical protein